MGSGSFVGRGACQRLNSKEAGVSQDTITLTRAEYERLLMAAEADDMIVRCEFCGAWMDRAEAACAPIEDFSGCWKMATGRESDAHLCVSHRALD